MLIGERIRKAVDKSGMDPGKAAAAISMSTANLYRIFKRDSVETKYLVRLSKLFGIPIKYFFEDIGYDDVAQGMLHQPALVYNTSAQATDLQHEIEKANQKIEQLELRLKDKDEIIRLLKDQLFDNA